MKKKTQRQLKKISKTLRRAWRQYGPLVDSRAVRALSALAGPGLLVAAAADPQIRQSAQALAAAVRDFLARLALGEGAFARRAGANEDDSDEEANADDSDEEANADDSDEEANADDSDEEASADDSDDEASADSDDEASADSDEEASADDSDEEASADDAAEQASDDETGGPKNTGFEHTH